MERFKGLAILATNRKKDLDEAFLRRLRYVIDFPMPGYDQRKMIWLESVPAGVDHDRLDIEFLARRFPLAGGHIRSIVFNACLQTAGRSRAPGERPELSMETVLVGVKREFDKLSRSISLEQFGPYAKLIEALDESGGKP
jgi:SpoVK/Ycf46/Vps4 family AAA+-type ATPase